MQSVARQDPRKTSDLSLGNFEVAQWKQVERPNQVARPKQKNIGVGENFSLFESNAVSVSNSILSNSTSRASGTNRASQSLVHADQHMETAIRLSKALKGRVHRARAMSSQGLQQSLVHTKKMGKLEQRKVGRAICEHLLASLRLQSEYERSLENQA
ncbi:MAG: hypothetical protein GXP16_15880 [Gammaproteobacteria bacterium]|nr:hypothetical protein [Gammaproteobacteria bacterium]